MSAARFCNPLVIGARWSRIDAAHWTASQDETSFTEWRAIGVMAGRPFVLIVNDGRLDELTFEGVSRLVEAAPELLRAARFAWRALREQRDGLLETHCLLDADLRPRRETPDRTVEPAIREIEGKIAIVEEALIRAGQVPS